MIPTPTEARALLHEFTQSPGLRKHAEAVGAAMRWYATKLQGDPGRWEAVGLLHDFDYERYPDLADHPYKGAEILRGRSVDEDFILDIFAHAPHTKQPRDTQLRKAIFACDELSGFMVDFALVTPHKKLAEVTVESVQKKLKAKGFAAKVSRAEIDEGGRDLDLSLAEHVQNVLTALQGAAATLGL